jgi:DNA-binding LytR/AlgR family response regulator
MQKWKCLIVDDEPPAISILNNYIGTLDYLEIIGTCSNAFEALEILNATKVDLMFLDVSIPKLLGTQMLRTIQHPPRVIFITAHRDYAAEAFELDAVDYLMKPVSFERFLKAVNKFRQVSTPETEVNGNTPGFLYFRTERKMVKVLLEDITYIESYRDYIIIHRLTGADLKVKCGISSVESMLPHNRFLRIHRSYIVSVARVTAFTTNDVEIGTRELPVGRSYQEVFVRLTSGNAVFKGDDPQRHDLGPGHDSEPRDRDAGSSDAGTERHSTQEARVQGPG